MKMMGKSKRRACDSCGNVIPEEQEKIDCGCCGGELCEGCVFTDIDGTGYCESCYDEVRDLREGDEA